MVVMPCLTDISTGGKDGDGNGAKTFLFCECAWLTGGLLYSSLTTIADMYIG
jgi:hypothetical protein